MAVNRASLEAGRPGGGDARRREARPNGHTSELLTSSANEFVADFVGRGRGYRSLGSPRNRKRPNKPAGGTSFIGCHHKYFSWLLGLGADEAVNGVGGFLELCFRGVSTELGGVEHAVLHVVIE